MKFRFTHVNGGELIIENVKAIWRDNHKEIAVKHGNNNKIDVYNIGDLREFFIQK